MYRRLVSSNMDTIIVLIFLQLAGSHVECRNSEVDPEIESSINQSDLPEPRLVQGQS